MYTITFWHCRLGSLSKFIARSLLPFLQKALHSIFHHALPSPPSVPSFRHLHIVIQSPALFIQLHFESYLLQLVLRRQQAMPKKPQRHVTCNPILASARLPEMILRPSPPGNRNIFLFGHPHSSSWDVSPCKKKNKVYSTVVFILLQALKQDSLVLQRN